jgi:D-alanyl-D-alanine dipeptidase
MPTEFDDFTPKAWITNDALSPEVKKNRDLLQTIMKKHGFEPVETEWWHFDLKGWQGYPVIASH